jgi:hypothetical protein
MPTKPKEIACPYCRRRFETTGRRTPEHTYLKQSGEPQPYLCPGSGKPHQPASDRSENPCTP